MAKQSTKQKFLSVLLAVSMMAGMFPASAIAEDELLTASAAVAEEAPADSENVQISTQDIPPAADDGDTAPLSDAADVETTNAQAPDAYVVAGAAAAEQQAYFIDKVKLVPIDIQPELKVPEDYTQVWEPDVQWNTDADISRDANVYLWFKYVMPEQAPEKGVTYTALIEAPLTCDEPMYMDIKCGGDKVATAVVDMTNIPGKLKMTITFDADAGDQYFQQGIPGYFWVAMQFDADQIDNDGKQKIEVSVDGEVKDSPTIGFAFTKPTVTANVKKEHVSHDIAPDEGPEEITWTSTVTIEGKDLPSAVQTTTITLDDVMQNQKYVQGSAKIVAVDGVENPTVTITEGEPEFDAAAREGRASLSIKNAPLGNGTHTVTVRYKTTYAGVENLPFDSKSDGKTVYAKIEFLNTVNGGVSVPNYKQADGELKLDEETPEYKVPFKEESTATDYLTIAGLTKRVSTTNLGGVNVALRDGTLFWQVLVDCEMDGQVLTDTIENGHQLVLDKEHPLTIGSYEWVLDKNGSPVKDTNGENKASYVGDTVTRTDFLPAGSTDAGIFAGTKVSNGTQYVINLGSAAGKTMVCYYTRITGTKESLANNVTLRASGLGTDGLSTKKTFNMRSTFLSKTSNRDTGYDPKTQKITWKVTVNGGGYMPGGITLEDVFNQSVGLSGVKEYDQKLLHDDSDPFTLEVTRGGQVTRYVLDYQPGQTTHSFVNEAAPTDVIGTLTVHGDDCKDTGFTVNLHALTAGYDSVVLNYKTQLLASDQEGVTTDLKSWINKGAEEVKVSNKITLKQGDDRPAITDAYWVYAHTPVLKKEPTLLDADGFATGSAKDAANNKNYDYTTGEAAWKITVNEAQMAFDTPLVLQDVLDYCADAAWSYVENSVKVKLAGKEITDFTTRFGQTADGKPTMTVTLPKVASGQGAYVVTYKTKVNKQPTADRPGLDSNEVQTLKNTVTLTGGPIVSGVTADSTVQITAGKISKSGSKDADFGQSHLVTWEIVVNKNLADLSQTGSEQIVIRDDLELGLLYMEDPTVQKFTKTKTAADGTIVPDGLENAELGEEWADYDPETRRLTFTFNKADLNGTGYVIRYQTRVIDGQKHSNKASYSVTGTASEKDSADAAVNSYYGNGFTVIPGTGTVLIRKQKSDGTALAGAVFTVSQEIDGRWAAIGTITTEGAYATIEGVEENAAMVGLKYGHYKVEEVEAPDGYVNGHFTQEFTLSKDNAVQTITCTNYGANEGGWLELTKTIRGPIAADTAVPTVQFTVTGPDGEQVGVYKLSDFAKEENGKYTLKIDKILPQGSYTVTETAQTPEGYTLAETAYEVGGQTGTGMTAQAAIAPGETTTVAFANTYQRMVCIAKVDAANPEQLIAGATLNLTNGSNVNVTWESTTEPKTFQLDAGTYTLTETVSPENYDLTEEAVDFTVRADGTVTGEGINFAGDAVVTIALANEEKGSLVLTKTITGSLTKEDAEASLRFTVTGPDGYHETFALTDGFVYDEAANTWTKTLDHLTRGEYTVTETITQDVEGYTLAQVSTKVQVGDGELAMTETKSAVSGDEIKVTTGVESTKTTTVAYTNRYSETPKSMPPVVSPSPSPSVSPSPVPSPSPSVSPSPVPSTSPSVSPSPVPSTTPSASPSPVPSTKPSASPSPVPSTTPSASPSPVPSTAPSASPSPVPSTTPSATPSPTPSATPSASPSPVPSTVPSATPSPAPSTTPSATPSPVPSATPSATPSPVPSTTPSATPAPASTQQPSTTPQPAAVPQPEKTPQPSSAPQVSIPQTGDTFPLLPTALTMAASGLALAALAVGKRRKKHK